MPVVELEATILYHGKYRPLLLNPLFVRVEKYIEPLMLEKQCRMHRDIALFPSTHFYCGRLSNGSNIERGDRERAFHGDPSGHFRAYLMWDVVGAEEKESNSLLNRMEIECLHRVLLRLLQNEPFLAQIQSIGILTPYSCVRSKTEKMSTSISDESMFDRKAWTFPREKQP